MLENKKDSVNNNFPSCNVLAHKEESVDRSHENNGQGDDLLGTTMSACERPASGEGDAVKEMPPQWGSHHQVHRPAGRPEHDTRLSMSLAHTQPKKLAPLSPQDLTSHARIRAVGR